MRLTEAAILFVIFLILILNADFQNVFKGAPKAHIFIIIIFFAMMLFAQYVNRPRTTFPFIRWSKFATIVSSDNAVIYEIMGVNREVSSRLINLPEIFVPVTHGYTPINYEWLIGRTLTAKKHPKELAEFMKKIQTNYNKKYPEHPLTKL